jgi:hypothetical protein
VNEQRRHAGKLWDVTLQLPPRVSRAVSIAEVKKNFGESDAHARHRFMSRLSKWIEIRFSRNPGVCLCGRLRRAINPVNRRGTRHGVPHGIGRCLMEDCAYDGDGNLLASTFSDYLRSPR